nr:MAG: DUF2127 domain-containing protein [Leptolyngbya sp. IPPAS B-1204]
MTALPSATVPFCLLCFQNDSSIKSMTSQIQRSISLKAIVAYKGFVVFSLIAISLICAFSWRNYDALIVFIQSFIQDRLDQESALSQWLLNTVLHIQPQHLQLVAQLTSVYAIVLGIVTVGLWYHKQWAHLLMLLFVGLPLPVEAYELLTHPAWSRGGILVLNLLVFGYLLRHQWTRLQKLATSVQKQP